MKHIQTSRFFSLLISLTLLIAPLPLSAMADDFISSLSTHDKEMMIEYPEESYVFLDKKLSNIAELVSRISELDRDNDSLLHELKRHIAHGYAIAEYNAVLETLNHAEKILEGNCTRFNNAKKHELLLQLEATINQVMNGELTVDVSALQPADAKKDDFYESNKGTRSPPYTATIQGLLSAADAVVTGSITTPTISVTDHVVQGTIYLEDTAQTAYVGLAAPSVVTSSYTLAFPPVAPTSNQVLRASTATPTNLTWVSEGGSVLPASSKTIYVTVYGNDTNGDGSFNSPYASLVKAIEVANTIASSINPVAILVGSGIYTENNSSGPLEITVAGISIVGASASSVVIMPSTPANTLLLIGNTVRIADVTFNTSAFTGTGISMTAGVLSVFNNVRVMNFLVGVNCAGGTSQSYGFDTCLFVSNGTALNVDNTRVELNTCSMFGTSSPTGPAANTAFSVTGSGATCVYTGGVISLCTTGADISGTSNNAQITINSVTFRMNDYDVVQAGSSHMALSGCTFELTNSSGDIDIQVSGAGSIAEIIGCEFDGYNSVGVAEGSSIVVTDGGYVNISSGIMHDYVTGIQVGGVSDTSSTVLLASGLVIQNCTTNILQQGTTTLNLNASTASSSAMSINSPTNVTMAFFDLDNGDALTIGAFADQDTTLIEAGIGTVNNPAIQYKTSLYSTQAIGFENLLSNPSTSFVISQENTTVAAITTNRADTAGLRLVSDTGSPVGTTSALRGWDITKNGSAATLSFNYQNSDTSGQTAVSDYTVMQLDGFNNLVNLPTAGTKIVFDTDTNLYRSAASVLKTDSNFIVGTLTAGRVVITDPSTNELSSSVTTSTELSYLSGTTSSVQTQINSKVAKAGDTMTGTLQLPAGTTSLPSLTFTGSTTTGLSAATANTLSFDTAGVERMKIDGSGNVTIDAFGVGVVHSSSAGLLSSSLIVDADITAATITNDKLANISSANTPGNIVVRDGSGNFATNMITLAGTTTNPTDAATKAYVDAAISLGLTIKNPAVVISLTNIALTGLQTIDGVSLVASDRVLLNGQTTTTENGLWVVASGAWTRPVDFAATTEAGSAYVLILDGTVYAGSSWLCSTPTAIIGTDPISFAEFSLPSQTTGANVGSGTGLIFRDKTGVTLNFKTLLEGDAYTIITNDANDVSLSTNATDSNTVSTIVARDSSGNFSAGTIFASLTGAASLDVLKAGDTMTGTLTHPAGTAAAPSIQFTGSTNTGFSAATANTLSFDTAGVERMKIDGSGNVTIDGLSATGVVHNSSAGLLTTSLIVNADVDPAAAIVDSKLATISTTGKVSNSATTATNLNTASAIVARDSSGNFSAGTIFASLTGAASLNVLKAGDTMTGTLQLPAGTDTTPTLVFTGSTTSGLSAGNGSGASDPGSLSFITDGAERMAISSGGAVSIDDLSGTAGIVHNDAFGNLSSSLIVDADVDPAAAIIDTKLATISTTGKVANSATTATPANTASTIVQRDSSGNFSAGTITASLTGAASLDVLKSGDTMTGTLTHPAGTAAAPSIQFTGSTNTGISAATTNTLSFDTNGVERLNISATGGVTIDALSTGVVHSSSAGLLSSSLIVNADITASTITNAKLATISNTNIAGDIVVRDGSGSFAAGLVSVTDEVISNTFAITSFGTAGVLHNDSSGNVTSSLIVNGDITAATITGASIASATIANANLATISSSNTAGDIVVRDGSGNFSAGTITATLNGSATNFSGSLVGDVTGTQGATVVSFVDGKTAADVAAATATVDAATNLNTASTLVERDGTGSFAAQEISMNDGILAGNLVLSTEPSTSSAGNIIKGSSRFIHDFGTDNTFVGINAGNFTTTGTDNTGIGYHALTANAAGANFNTAVGSKTLAANTTGVDNTALGYNALAVSTTGTDNTAIGYNALAANATGTSFNTAVGSGALAANTTGAKNVAVGYQAMANTTGISNDTAIGYQALKNDQGGFNTAMGYNALAVNTTGVANTAVGYNALTVNTIGVANTALGISALAANTTGSNNAAIGDGALLANTTGSSNIAIGSGALQSNVTGANNIAIGQNTVGSIVSGNNNTAVGISAMGSSTGGVSNDTAIGYQALIHDKAGNNTAVGYSALAANTTGADNTAVGYNALLTNSTGTDCTALGYNALTLGTGNFNTAIGSKALATLSTAVDNTAVGYLALNANSTGSDCTAVGYNALPVCTGIENTAIGSGAGVAITTGTNNIIIGYDAGATLVTGAGNIYINANAGSSSEATTTRIGTSQSECFIAGITGVGVSGDVVVVTGSGQLGITTSSRRYKHDIQDMGTDSAEIFKLRPVTFAYNNDETDTKQYGLIAEEVEEIFPTLISRDEDGTISTVRYHLLPALLLNEIQKQHATIEEMKQDYVTVEAMNNAIASLKSELQNFMARMIN